MTSIFDRNPQVEEVDPWAAYLHSEFYGGVLRINETYEIVLGVNGSRLQI